MTSYLLFLIIGCGIYSPSTKNIYLDNGLVTIPKIGPIDLKKDNSQFIIS